MANEMNVTIMGRLGSDPLLHLSDGKKPFVRVNLATSTRVRKDEEWVDGHTSWYELKAWGDMARNIAASLSKGTAVVVHGELRIEQFTNEQGVTFKSAVILVDSIGTNLRFAQSQTIKVRHEDSQDGESKSEFSIEASLAHASASTSNENETPRSDWESEADVDVDMALTG